MTANLKLKTEITRKHDKNQEIEIKSQNETKIEIK